MMGGNWLQMTVEGVTGEGGRLKRVKLWCGRLLIDIVLVMDDVGGIYPETCTGGTFGSTYD